MIDIVKYIKKLFASEDRKRKATCDLPYSPAKFRKTRAQQMPNAFEGEEWFLSSASRRRSSLFSSVNPSKSNSSKENITIIVDDDPEDILESSKSKFNSKFSSTPNFPLPRSQLHQNGEEDVTFLRSSKGVEERKLKANRAGYDYIMPYNYLSDNHSKPRNSKNSKQEIISPLLSSIKDIKPKSKMTTTIPSAVLQQSFRLDEKMKYKQLLAQATPNCSPLSSSFAKYSTPTGKIFVEPFKRGNKIMNMALNKNGKPATFIDLTVNGSGDAPRKQLTTKDTIQKILDYPLDPIVIKDSDSDVEVLPQPPSPKPDFKVERVNSLKKIVDTSEKTHEEWLNRIIEKHKRDVAKVDSDIRNQTAQRQKIGEVCSVIQAQRLEEQMVKCLKIKDAVLPIHIEEAIFPELSADDDFRIDRAIRGKRVNPTEVLVSKFNLNITRADIQTFDGLNWLNDEVINFYMNLLIERGKDTKWPKAYAMNTFFFPKLLKDGPNSLRRWTRRVDIFSYDIIAVPIHLGMHWCMSIINFTNSSIKYYDSMGRSNNRCLEALLNYLKFEHLDKKQREYDVSEWILENVQDIPQQMNGSDCGVFSCTYAEFLTRNADLSFGQENMPYLRRKMVLEILNGELLIQ